MPNTFLLKTDASVGTTLTSVYAVPSARTGVVIGCILSNTSAGSIKVSVKITTNATSGEDADDVWLIRNLPLSAGSSFELIEGKVVLGSQDFISAESDTASSLDITLSVMEQS